MCFHTLYDEKKKCGRVFICLIPSVGVGTKNSLMIIFKNDDSFSFSPSLLKF